MESIERIKICRECALEFEGRLNQQFCSSKCRFNFNNGIARKKRNQINLILKILLRNREILESFYEAGVKEISKNDLSIQRFNFNYLTNQLRTKEGTNYVFSFEYGFAIINDTIIITKYDGIF
jgi:hypothetical protein